jgi:pimeloyl-ACP methyl ester carboxylesterase
MTKVHRVSSADGTPIAYRAAGKGEPILFVHGMATSGADWLFALPFLRDRYTVVMMDRRGRGNSGDGDDYALEREAEDVVAVLDAVGGELLVGHSYGAMCSVNAAALTDRLRRVVLYEPPIGVPLHQAEKLGQVVATGDLDGALSLFLAAAGVRPDELEAIRSSPAWPVLLTAMPALPREMVGAATWQYPPGPLEVPVLFLLGGETRSPAYFDGLDDLLATFPALRRATIAGQQHIGHVLAAQEFAGLVADFVGHR